MGLFFLLLTALVGMGVVTAGVQTNAARDYHADVLEEISSSNFNENVMRTCIEEAKEAGYHLQIKQAVYDEANHVQLVSVTLDYEYAIPLLNLFSNHEIRGMAG